MASVVPRFGDDLAVVHAKLSNGKIESVEDLETFVNELEKALSDLDPGAAITMRQPL